MRTITEYTERPKEREVIQTGTAKTVFVRTNIEEIETEDGTKYSAVEYSTKVRGARFSLTEEFVDALIADETAKAAAAVRAKRNALLADSDKEVLPDRLTKTSAAFKAWSDYREALRDITEQEGFPFDVEFPVKPE